MLVLLVLLAPQLSPSPRPSIHIVVQSDAKWCCWCRHFSSCSLSRPCTPAPGGEHREAVEYGASNTASAAAQLSAARP